MGRRHRLGGTRALIALSVLLLAGLSVLAWQMTRAPAPPEPVPQGPAPSISGPAPVDSPHAELQEPEHVRSGTPAQPVEPEGGAIDCEVLAAPGMRWSGASELWIEHVPTPGRPSSLPGAYREVEDGFVQLSGLQPGRYRAWARAPARRSASFECVLTSASPRASLSLPLLPAGALRGRLVDERGRGLADMPVHLLGHAQATAESVRCDEQGQFVISEVLNGSWALFAGPKSDPLLRLDAVETRGTDTDLGVVTVTNLGDLRVTVLDVAGRPIEGARVWDGETFGHFDLKTDAQGVVHARFLPAKQLRIFVEQQSHGRTNAPVQLENGQEATLELRFKN